MSTTHHGIQVGLAHTKGGVYLHLKLIGKLTAKDYQGMIPWLNMVFNSIKKPSINVLVDATELTGWELRAAWEDLKLAVLYYNKFSRIAFFGNQHWQSTAAKLANWCMKGEMSYFEDIDQAKSWLIR